MQNMLKKFADILRSDYHERQRYFVNCAQEISASNLSRLRVCCGGLVALLLILIPTAEYVIDSYSVTWHYWFFLAVSLGYAALVEAYAHRTAAPGCKTVERLCIGFLAMLFLCCMLLDVYPSRNYTASFMPVLLAVAPLLFTLPYTVQVPFSLLMLALFFPQVVYVKAASNAQLDIFNALFGVLASIITSSVTMNLRVRDGNSKMYYKNLSSMDALTGVNSRGACEVRIRHYLLTQEPCALLLLDVDDFKSVNDRLGHQAGDDLLRSIGRILLSATKSGDVVGRMGGDEFMLLLCGVDNLQTLEKICRRILHSGADLVAGHSGVHIGYSIGAVLVHGETAFEQLYHMTDEALYQAKLAGKNRCVIQAEGQMKTCA